MPGCTSLVDGKPQLIEVDTIVVCAGQEPRRELVADALDAAGIACTLIGGADVAVELDANARSSREPASRLPSDP